MPPYIHLAGSRFRSLHVQVHMAGGSKQQRQGKKPQQNASRPSAEQALGQSPHKNRSLGSRQKQGNWAAKGAEEATGAPLKPRPSREGQNLDSVKGRTWNTGVGPRPGGALPLPRLLNCLHLQFLHLACSQASHATWQCPLTVHQHSGTQQVRQLPCTWQAACQMAVLTDIKSPLWLAAHETGALWTCPHSALDPPVPMHLRI